MDKGKKIKVVTIVGTRPEIIRLSRVMMLLDEFVDQIIVHTGQNYDYELNEIFFKDLEIRKPDYFLNVNTSSLGKVYGETISKSEEVLVKEKPDAVLILGDTNSSIAGIIAKRLRIPVYHMEAGNRCFDFNVPEEINRRIIDHIADFNLVYTENARRHLISEGIPHRRIYVTGSPIKEVVNYYKPKINKSGILSKLKLNKKNYFLVSAHREENVDNKKNLESILVSLNEICNAYNIPVIISTHPRTRKRLELLKSFKYNKNLIFLKPFGFLDYVKLQMNSFCTISDSGTICEESSMLNFPAITIRNAMERPEAMDSGSIILTGLKPDIILNSIKVVTSEEKYSSKEVPADYKIENTSMRVLKIILGTSKLSNKWHGIERY
jgi:UDP-N-acetyl-L-fucosamine synthase